MIQSVDFRTFRELLQRLENSDAAIRLRMSGEGWTDFSTLILLSESAMIVQMGAERRVILNLRNIVEFELDQPHLDFAARNVYEVAH